MPALGRFFIIAGLLLVVIGILFIAFSELGIVKLPGDLIYRKGGFTIIFPIVTSVLLSIILTFILNVLLRR